MSILRKRVKHYGKLPSSTIRDRDLKDGALGLLLRIVDLPDNWVVRADTLAAGRPQGRDATAAELRNLAQCGYYRVERRKMRNGRFQMGTAISEERVPQWKAEYEEFAGKPIPLIEQEDGTFKVRRKDGTTTDDGFVGEYAPGAQDFPMPHETPGHAGHGKSGSGKEYDLGLDAGTDISGHGFSGSGNPDSGTGGPFSTTEKYSPEVETPPLLAAGELRAVTRGGPEAPAAQDQDHLSRLAWRTATFLPRRYRDGLPSELRFPMVHEIRGALSSGYGTAAVLRYAEICQSNAAYANDKHLPLLRASLALLRQEVRLGLVCPECGNEPADPFGPPCVRCRPDRAEMTETDLAELEAARRYIEGEEPGVDDPGPDPDGLPPFDGLFPLSEPHAPQARPEAAQNGRTAPDGARQPSVPPRTRSGDLRGSSDGSDSSDQGGPDEPSGDDHRAPAVEASG